jgi:hypothetical protein
MIEIELAPDLIFISPDVWCDDLGRDTALGLLLDYLDEIEKLRIVSVLWSERMEELLWSDPALPPWRRDRDWRLKLVPIIAAKFQRVVKFLDVSVECEGSGFVPPGSLASVRADIADAFRNLSHQAAFDAGELILCLGEPQDSQPPFSFQCGSCAVDATVRPIGSPPGLGRNHEIAAQFWLLAEPKSAADIDALLSLALRWQADNAIPRYRATYAPSFVESIASAANKAAIFEALAKRISKTEDEAKHDHGLHDEPVRSKAKKGIRRFRVSIAERIHYEYPAAQEIRFVDYFPEGRHDEGL